MAYQVKLEVFEGPFDLLLQLISRRKLDVTEVDLADITADFLAHLERGIEDLDLETATRFLVVAATLIELKAARLLPREERDELEDLLGDARDLLYARLLEYRAFRDVARIFAHRLTMHESSLGREVAPEPWLQRLVPATPLSVDVAGLAAIAASALTPTTEAPVDLSHIRRSYITIREAAVDLMGLLGDDDGTPATFADLVGGRDRGDRVVYFLALLELFKLGHVDLDQPDHRGPLAIARRHGGQDLASLTEDDDPDASDGAEAPLEAPGELRGVS
ncbi:ScpA family protein [Egicoccus sp. AB-alg6-2]|uniref:segregation and condensation protein A n=1 Tax=Egicoccus sp. AB-alg6-2 TaxID=3242692 RepID=UPI00359D7C5A